MRTYLFVCDGMMPIAAMATSKDGMRAAAKRKERVCRLAICAAAVAAPFVLFYSIGSY